MARLLNVRSILLFDAMSPRAGTEVVKTPPPPRNSENVHAARRTPHAARRISAVMVEHVAHYHRHRPHLPWNLEPPDCGNIIVAVGRGHRSGGVGSLAGTRKRGDYYRPADGRRLRRCLWRRLVPWPVRWLFPGVEDAGNVRSRHAGRWLPRRKRTA